MGLDTAPVHKFPTTPVGRSTAFAVVAWYVPMAPNQPDDPSFAEAMAQLGVTPLAKGSARSARQSGDRSGRRDARSSQGQSPGRNAAKAVGRAPGREYGQSGFRPDQSARARAGSSASVADLGERERGELSRRLAEAEAAQRALQTERDRLLGEHEAERQRWQREREELLAQWQRERAAKVDQLTELRREYTHAEAILAKRRTLRTALEERGCASDEEAIAVLRGLAALRPSDFMDAVDLISAAQFAHLLDQRVAFVAADVDMGDDPGCVVVRVAPERCEITGGSDIQAGFRRFAEACARAHKRKVTIVGGSPAYRRQLQRLGQAADGELSLILVSGTQRRTRRRAEADMRASDLVVIWGATELDHSVSAVYKGAPEKTIRVPHRGISRMLLFLASKLDGRDGRRDKRKRKRKPK